MDTYLSLLNSVFPQENFYVFHLPKLKAKFLPAPSPQFRGMTFVTGVRATYNFK